MKYSRISSGSVANHTGPRTLESPLKHCDSAQRASTGQPGATPNGTYFVFVVPPSGGNRHSGPCEFRLKAVLQTSEPGAAFIRIHGFSCPRLICTSLSGSSTASIKDYSFVVRGPTMHFILRRTLICASREPCNRGGRCGFPISSLAVPDFRFCEKSFVIDRGILRQNSIRQSHIKDSADHRTWCDPAVDCADCSLLRCAC